CEIPCSNVIPNEFMNHHHHHVP
ncbi:unnamed protein product, partial [Rotaria sp. Silwood2]